MLTTIIFALGVPLWLVAEEVMRRQARRSEAHAKTPAPHAAGVTLSRLNA